MSLEGCYARDEKTGAPILDKETGQPIWHGPARAEVEYWRRRALAAEGSATTVLGRVQRNG